LLAPLELAIQSKELGNKLHTVRKKMPREAPLSPMAFSIIVVEQAYQFGLRTRLSTYLQQNRRLENVKRQGRKKHKMLGCGHNPLDGAENTRLQEKQ
jgi:hypothetical protein